MKENNIETPKIGDILQDEFLDPLELTAYRLNCALLSTHFL